MKYIDINGKMIRKDPVYYLQDVLEYPEYDGSYDRIEQFLENIDEVCEIHFINTKCIAGALLDVFISAGEKSDNLTVLIDD
ncbi:MAG: hypothetical protein IKF79_00440 [Methanosphaera sp.]|nr:hypothetical protein [Methanosphaera sp.]